MKKINIGAVVLIVLFALLIYAASNAPEPLNELPDYTSGSEIPRGGKLSYDFFEDMQGLEPEKSLKPAYSLFNNESYSKTNYIIFNSTFTPDKYDVEELLRFVQEGNTAFIAAYGFSKAFADTLKFKTGSMLSEFISNDTSGQQTLQSVSLNATPVINFVNPNLRRKTDFVYKEKWASNIAFTTFDTTKCVVLGNNDQGYANFIRMPFGKGQIFLHTIPDVFSNYNVSDSLTAPYAFRAFSYLPKQRAIWDDYYKDGFTLGRDTRRVILADESLRTAYLIIAALLVLWIIFGARRRQRIIPVVKPLQNTTLEFVEVVGTLYYHQHNTADIMHKKITYFLESIRTRFYIRTQVFDDHFMMRVAALSGVSEPQVRELFGEIGRLQHYMTVQDSDLKRLEQLMWEFNKNSKR